MKLVDEKEVENDMVEMTFDMSDKELQIAAGLGLRFLITTNFLGMTTEQAFRILEQSDFDGETTKPLENNS